MTMDDISSLSSIFQSSSHSHLYLWTTNGFMEKAFEVVRRWGFDFKTIITWTKTKSDGTPSMKTGYYYRGATEHILFATKGNMRLSGPAHPTSLLLPRLPHSQKPEEFYRMVESQSPGPYLELFARKSREGWDSWGNEIDITMQ